MKSISNRKAFVIFIVFFIIVAGASVGVFAWLNLRGAGQVTSKPPDDITEIIRDGKNKTGFPLKLPAGFDIEIFAENVPGARVLVQDALGNFWVSQTKKGIVSQITTSGESAFKPNLIFRDLNRPHGLAIDPQDGTVLYIAESNKISRVQLYSEASLEKIADLPDGGRHFTRTIAFGPDNRLYVSIGSSCDTCMEDDERRAAIYSMNKDGSDFKQYATGLRNAVFFAWSEVDGRMWTTEMGRDFLNDDLPPDEINIIYEGENYGWPFCYGTGTHDITFDISQDAARFCANEATPSYINLQAHVAPLGLAFVREEGWPQDMWYDLIVAEHGSWNRSEPVGYKLTRLKLDAAGNFLGEEDFITGWLTEDGALGRPVDVLIQPGGIMYVTDDHAGVIYRITYQDTP